LITKLGRSFADGGWYASGRVELVDSSPDVLVLGGLFFGVGNGREKIDQCTKTSVHENKGVVECVAVSFDP